MKVTYFTEIKNYTTPALQVFEHGYIKELKKYDLDFKEFSIYQTNRFKDREWIALLISAVNRYVIYPLKARKHFSPEINHISNNAYAHILNFAPKGCKTIVHCHDLVSWMPLKNMTYKLDKGGMLRHLFVILFKKRGIKKADHLIAISHNTKKDLIKYIKLPEEKITVIHNGVDHETFHLRNKLYARRKLNLPGDRKIILSVSSKEHRKNIESLIEAFSIISKDIFDLKLVHIGQFSKRSKDIISKFELMDKINCLTNVSEKRLALFYNAADLFVFPSLYEGFGLPPLEAMASGCPVITSNTSSLPEIVGNAGIMVDPHDLNSLAEKMHEVLTDENLRKEMIKKGLDQAEKFSWGKSAEETIQLYKKILNND